MYNLTNIYVGERETDRARRELDAEREGGPVFISSALVLPNSFN